MAAGGRDYRIAMMEPVALQMKVSDGKPYKKLDFHSAVSVARE